MSEIYKGFDVNTPTDTPPWGTREEQVVKDLIDNVVGDAITATSDTTGHKHYTLYDKTAATVAVTADSSVITATAGSGYLGVVQLGTGYGEMIVGAAGSGSHAELVLTSTSTTESSRISAGYAANRGQLAIDSVSTTTITLDIASSSTTINNSIEMVGGSSPQINMVAGNAVSQGVSIQMNGEQTSSGLIEIALLGNSAGHITMNGDSGADGCPISINTSGTINLGATSTDNGIGDFNAFFGGTVYIGSSGSTATLYGNQGVTVESGSGAVSIEPSCVVTGAFGCNGTSPQPAYVVGSAAATTSDSGSLGQVVDLANNIRLALIANGIAITA